MAEFTTSITLKGTETERFEQLKMLCSLCDTNTYEFDEPYDADLFIDED